MSITATKVFPGRPTPIVPVELRPGFSLGNAKHGVYLDRNYDPAYHGAYEAGYEHRSGLAYRRYRRTAVGALVALLWALRRAPGDVKATR